MATRYTSDKAPGMTVVVSKDGIFVDLSDGLVQVTANRPAEMETLVLDQFHVHDPAITWHDLTVVTIAD